MNADDAQHETPTYHDLHITTPDIERTSIFNLPYNIEVTCARAAGWRAWRIPENRSQSVLLGGEYDGDQWLVLDVAGYVICDGRGTPDGDTHA